MAGAGEGPGSTGDGTPGEHDAAGDAEDEQGVPPAPALSSGRVFWGGES